LHVSEWDTERTENISDVCKEGDLVDVIIVDVEEGNRGKIRASRKRLPSNEENGDENGDGGED